MALRTAQNQVAAAIKDLDTCPDSVKQLLLTALPNAFGPDLHQYQKEAAQMLRKCLEDARASAGEAQVATSQRVNEAKTVLEALQADVQHHTNVEEAARANVDEKVAAETASQATAQSEEKVCKEAGQERSKVEAERQKLESAKSEVESLATGSFRMLTDGGWEDVEVRDACIDAVCSYLKEQGVDAVLLAALPKALVKRPADCGVFDKIALDEAKTLFASMVAKSSRLLAEKDEEFADIKAEHTGAGAVRDLAWEKVCAHLEARSTAEAELQQATVEKKLAQSKVMDQEATLATLQSEASLTDAKVQQLDTALSGFALLEAGEPQEADKENKDGGENKENVMNSEGPTKSVAMEVDQGAVAATA